MNILKSATITVLLAFGIATMAAGQQPPPMPTPGPEHEVLKREVGTWDAVVELTPGQGAPPTKSTGVEVNTMGCGGLCLITDLKADMMGVAFEGHGIGTWDAAKKKYVGTWMDSMSTGIAVTEGTYDAAARRFTGSVEGPDATGKVTRSRTVSEWRDEKTRVFTMHVTGSDGKDAEVLRITYTKR
jgi:hypothetical protein